jgi:hypothetical protein
MMMMIVLMMVMMTICLFLIPIRCVSRVDNIFLNI